VLRADLAAAGGGIGHTARGDSDEDTLLRRLVGRSVKI